MRARLALAAALLLAACGTAPTADAPTPSPVAPPQRPAAAPADPAPPAEAPMPAQAPAAPPEAATAEVARAPVPTDAELAARFEAPTVLFLTERGEVPVTVELALTPAQQAQGLMFRQYLPDGQGMLFVFPAESVQSFWMKNTLIELDMIHLDTEGRVVGIVARAEPETLTPRTVGVPARYVLEVPGGWAERAGVTVGTQARFAHVGPAR